MAYLVNFGRGVLEGTLGQQPGQFGASPVGVNPETIGFGVGALGRGQLTGDQLVTLVPRLAAFLGAARPPSPGLVYGRPPLDTSRPRGLISMGGKGW